MAETKVDKEDAKLGAVAEQPEGAEDDMNETKMEPKDAAAKEATEHKHEKKSGGGCCGEK